MTELHLTSEEVAALKETFRLQAEELLHDYGRYVLELESAAQSDDVLKAIQRVVHTIKGDSMSLEFEQLAMLAHRLEDQLDALRKSDLPVGRSQVDLLLACGDAMSVLLKGYCAEPPQAPIDITPLCLRIDEALGGGEASEPSPTQPERFRLAVTFARKCQMHSAGAYLIRQRLEEQAKIIEVQPSADSPEIEKAKHWSLIVESSSLPDDLKRAARVVGISSRVKIETLPALEADVGSSGLDGNTPASEGTGTGNEASPPPKNFRLLRSAPDGGGQN